MTMLAYFLIPPGGCITARDLSQYMGLLDTCRLSDLVGADVGLHVGKNFVEAFPERTYNAKLIVKLNEAKRLGEKTGAGFYKYDAKRKTKPDPELAPIVEASRKVSAAMEQP